MAKKVYRQMINNGIQPTPGGIKNEIDKLDGRVAINSDNLNHFVIRFIDEIESGDRLYNSKRYSVGTIKNYKGTQSQLNEYIHVILHCPVILPFHL